jgi:hypothetical protein
MKVIAKIVKFHHSKLNVNNLKPIQNYHNRQATLKCLRNWTKLALARKFNSTYIIPLSNNSLLIPMLNRL